MESSLGKIIIIVFFTVVTIASCEFGALETPSIMEKAYAIVSSNLVGFQISIRGLFLAMDSGFSTVSFTRLCSTCSNTSKLLST